MNHQLTLPRDTNRHKRIAHRTLTLRQRFAATLLRVARPAPLHTVHLTAARMPLHSTCFPPFVSPSVSLVRINPRRTTAGRAN
ncbi:hypothetical protein LJ656_08795 [Paraburkholderia sp. MMS20-SJTR3]|uniref:Uncharacterized protein n=1 Tax=Paraburkholderia sejongensis TaxID=2886946 RepID=A0ABS8JSJ1_9BURK|nr:hypothetical protein [Paraburkholderia sp. MMS20-SJTR3]MCC8392683.1 hypothetical protein [Paraburkholderia sp. MMS20-SJTR3]